MDSHEIKDNMGSVHNMQRSMIPCREEKWNDKKMNVPQYIVDGCTQWYVLYGAESHFLMQWSLMTSGSSYQLPSSPYYFGVCINILFIVKWQGRHKTTFNPTPNPPLTHTHIHTMRDWPTWMKKLIHMKTPCTYLILSMPPSKMPISILLILLIEIIIQWFVGRYPP